MPPNQDNNPAPGPFQTTRWTLIHSAGRLGTNADRDALSEFYSRYWKPLYVYTRGRGFTFHQSEDYVQSFFVWLMEHDVLDKADASRGKFRSFLITAFKNFIHNEYRKARAIKRGGNLQAVQPNTIASEDDFDRMSADTSDPQKLYDRAWAISMLDITKKRLDKEMQAAGNQELYEQLKGILLARSQKGCYAGIAAELGMTENAVRVAAHRYRKRYGNILREEIGRTVEREDHIEEEIRDLLAILGE